MIDSLNWTELDDKAVDTARVLAADAVEKVGNGHPGTAISLAPVAHLLYQHVMRHDPADPKWIGRDRFVLSIGHSSLTQYVQLYLGGFGLEIEDIKALRTWDSKTPGHPEYGHTDGVEITTGPLGQGLASAVGMAYAARYERGLFDPNTPKGGSPFDHFVYVVAGDGDLQEGVTAEASSLAGHQQLGNLITIYDSNDISIEDDTKISYTEDVKKRYESYGWQVLEVDWKKGVEYNEDVAELYEAIQEAKAESEKPTLIILKTIIGWPSPKKQNTGGIHGAALGKDEITGLKQALGFDPELSFEVAPAVIEHTRALGDRAKQVKSTWVEEFEAWANENPDKKDLFERIERRELPADIETELPDFEGVQSLSTRAASGKTLAALGSKMPELWGGSADLADSNNTTIPNSASFIPEKWSTSAYQGNEYGRVLHFGIREHAMGAILNGIALHGNTRAYGGTFLIFSDYMRPAVRLAALMDIPSIFVWTHDSIALGEDGPTHQPIEHLWSLRAIPNLSIVRPADAHEVAVAWHEILENAQGPTGIALTRQNVPVYERGEGEASTGSLASAQMARKGAYVLAETPTDSLDVLLLATGSEVELALEAREQLKEQGVGARVISMPCIEWFENQSPEYREEVLPKRVKARVSVEAGSALGWHKYTGDLGENVAIDHFGASADYKTLFSKFGLTAEAVKDAALKSLERAVNNA